MTPRRRRPAGEDHLALELPIDGDPSSTEPVLARVEPDQERGDATSRSSGPKGETVRGDRTNSAAPVRWQLSDSPDALGTGDGARGAGVAAGVDNGPDAPAQQRSSTPPRLHDDMARTARRHGGARA